MCLSHLVFLFPFVLCYLCSLLQLCTCLRCVTSCLSLLFPPVRCLYVLLFVFVFSLSDTYTIRYLLPRWPPVQICVLNDLTALNWSPARAEATGPGSQAFSFYITVWRFTHQYSDFVGAHLSLQGANGMSLVLYVAWSSEQPLKFESILKKETQPASRPSSLAMAKLSGLF